jgi:Spy/CpxP family protein refolding chaperone
MKKLVLGALAIAIALSSSTVFAHVGCGPGRSGPGAMEIPMVLHTLNLTSEQRAQIHKIMKSNRATLMPLFAQLRQGRQQLASEFFSPNQVTMSDLNKIEQSNEKIRQQIRQTFLQMALQIRGVLTAAQIKQGAVTLAKLQQLQNQMHTLLANAATNMPPSDD